MGLTTPANPNPAKETEMTNLLRELVQIESGLK
jgi:hypothetical protein